MQMMESAQIRKKKVEKVMIFYKIEYKSVIKCEKDDEI